MQGACYAPDAAENHAHQGTDTCCTATVKVHRQKHVEGGEGKERCLILTEKSAMASVGRKLLC